MPKEENIPALTVATCKTRDNTYQPEVVDDEVRPLSERIRRSTKHSQRFLAQVGNTREVCGSSGSIRQDGVKPVNETFGHDKQQTAAYTSSSASLQMRIQRRQLRINVHMQAYMPKIGRAAEFHEKPLKQALQRLCRPTAATRMSLRRGRSVAATDNKLISR